MAIFHSLYQKLINLSQHKHASRYLAGISFAESSLFPIPPDVMLIPMTLAKVEKAWYYAMITTVASVLGGLLGYAIGYHLLVLILPWLQQTSYWSGYLAATTWIQHHGLWILIAAGAIPIPYKFFTIGAGALQVPLVPFIIASFIGRLARFYLVSALLVWRGERMHEFIIKNSERIGWFSLFLLVIIVLCLHWFGA